MDVLNWLKDSPYAALQRFNRRAVAMFMYD